MVKIKALLFDLDGTLIDSEFFHFELWNEILIEHGASLTYEQWLKNYAGVPLPANAKILKEKYDIPTPLHELIKKREDLTLERLKTKDVNLMPFAAEILGFFHQLNLKLALVTSSPRADVDAVFSRNGMGKYFNVIVTRSDVEKSKPDPESYNLCIEKLGVKKDECVVFEDTINGLKAGKAAGLVCYAVQSDKATYPALAIADKIFPDLSMAKDFISGNEFYIDNQ